MSPIGVRVGAESRELMGRATVVRVSASVTADHPFTTARADNRGHEKATQPLDPVTFSP
jgi:hypothetical protein